jgi:hypothetical protein
VSVAEITTTMTVTVNVTANVVDVTIETAVMIEVTAIAVMIGIAMMKGLPRRTSMEGRKTVMGTEIVSVTAITVTREKRNVVVVMIETGTTVTRAKRNVVVVMTETRTTVMHAKRNVTGMLIVVGKKRRAEETVMRGMTAEKRSVTLAAKGAVRGTVMSALVALRGGRSAMKEIRTETGANLLKGTSEAADMKKDQRHLLAAPRTILSSCRRKSHMACPLAVENLLMTTNF